MKRTAGIAVIFCLIILALASCGPIGSTSAPVPLIYGAAALLSLVLAAVCCAVVRRREPWCLALFCCVVATDVGYFLLSVAQSLSAALWANRLAYLGAVFMPLCMLMQVLGLCRFQMPRQLPLVLGGVGLLVFLVTASPGLLDIYYKTVSLQIVDGVSSLVKTYGSWHNLYLIYLLATFGAMLLVMAYSAGQKQLESLGLANVMSIIVLSNLLVWVVEQLVPINFEFLSISYLISELFLLAIFMLLRERDRCPAPAEPTAALPEPPADPLHQFADGVRRLTPTEKAIFTCYLDGLSTKEILEKMAIKENTLKYHNRNIYGKLGVSSRKQLVEVAAQLEL